LSGHPTLETIAAFLDGRLQGDQKAEVQAHLADCDECYEVFSEVVHIQAEEWSGQAQPLQFVRSRDRKFDASKSRSRRRTWLTPAIAAGLAAGIGLWIFQARREPSFESRDLAAALVKAPDARNALDTSWPSTMRGPEEGLREALTPSAFRSGGLLVQAYLAADLENREVLAHSLDHLKNEEDNELFLHDIKVLTEQLEKKELPQEEILRSISQLERDLRRRYRIVSPYFAFGQWTEAGHLASRAQAAGFFTARANRDFPTKLQHAIQRSERRLPSIPEKARRPLETIERNWPQKGELTPKQAKALAVAFHEILQLYDDRFEPRTGDMNP